MTQANNSILVTPGVGETVATHAANSKEHETIMLADVSGHILGSKPTYAFNIAPTVHVNSANTVMFDLFNADATFIVRVISIRQVPDISQAVTGVVFAWKLARTTSVGTGGTGQTSYKYDSNDSAIDADVTCRLKPSGGAAEGTILFNYSLSSEETNAGTIQLSMQGGLELIPLWLQQTGEGIVLRQNEGLRCVQITASAAGNTGWLIVVTQE